MATTPLLRNLDRNSGATVHRRGVPYDGVVGPYLEAIYLPPQRSFDNFNERYLRRLLDLCASKRIQVYWLIPPLIPSLQARREQVGNDGAYTRFTQRFQARYPGLGRPGCEALGIPTPGLLRRGRTSTSTAP